VLGDASRSSLVARFINRDTPLPSPSAMPNQDNASAAHSNHDAMSTASSLHSASMMQVSLSSTVASTAAAASPNNSLLYHKKDVTLHHRNDETNDAAAVVCVRTQIWNVNLSSSVVVGGGSINDSMISSLLKKCHGFVLAVRAPSRSCHSGGSCSNSIASASVTSAYYSSGTNDCEYSNGWPELYLVIRQIEGWLTFLRSSMGDDVSFNIIVLLTDNNNDEEEEIVANYSLRNWMELSQRMEMLCHDYNDNTVGTDMIGWRLVSTRNSMESHCQSNSHEFDSFAVKSKNHSFVKRLQEEQRKMQQDMVDGVELAFVELIQSFLMKC
jgi:hypothetical protein